MTLKSPSRRVRRYAAELEELTPALLDACDYRCQLSIPGVCKGGRLVPHHRKLRSQGGLNNAATVVMVDDACHARIHSSVAESHLNGWLIWSWESPESIPFVSFRGAE